MLFYRFTHGRVGFVAGGFWLQM